jgi:hypothetical protein
MPQKSPASSSNASGPTVPSRLDPLLVELSGLLRGFGRLLGQEHVRVGAVFGDLQDLAGQLRPLLARGGHGLVDEVLGLLQRGGGRRGCRYASPGLEHLLQEGLRLLDRLHLCRPISRDISAIACSITRGSRRSESTSSGASLLLPRLFLFFGSFALMTQSP